MRLPIPTWRPPLVPPSTEGQAPSPLTGRVRVGSLLILQRICVIEHWLIPSVQSHAAPNGARTLWWNAGRASTIPAVCRIDTTMPQRLRWR